MNVKNDYKDYSRRMLLKIFPDISIEMIGKTKA